MLNLPPLSVVVVRSRPLTGLRISTVALGTRAPVGSRTVPVTEVELPPCAVASDEHSSPVEIMNAAKPPLLSRCMTPPIDFYVCGARLDRSGGAMPEEEVGWKLPGLRFASGIHHDLVAPA